MEQPPGNEQQIRDIQALLNTLTPDDPGRPGLLLALQRLQFGSIVGPQVIGPVQPARDANFAGIQVFINGPVTPESEPLRYRYLELLIAAAGEPPLSPMGQAVQPGEDPLLKTMRRWGHADPHGRLRRLRVDLITGTFLWILREMAVSNSDLPLPAPNMAALLLWPMLSQEDAQERREIGKLLALLCGEELAELFDAFYLRWDQAPNATARQELTFVAVADLSLPVYQAGIARLYRYFSAAEIWKHANADWWTLKQTTLPTAPGEPSRPTASGAGNGVTAAPTIAQPHGGAEPRIRVQPQIVPTKAGNLRLPRSPAQWQAEFHERMHHSQPYDPAIELHPYWCYIAPHAPGFQYQIGGWKATDPSANLELRRPFWIGRVPITVLQYRPFVAEGYVNRSIIDECWTGHGAQWLSGAGRLTPITWERDHFDHNYQPVTGVSWYEAAAFTRWLTLQHGAVLGDRYEIRLPTEAEWEIAAAYRGERRMRYTWGGEPPDQQRLAWQFGFDDGPPTVGGFPDGVAACGALDMAGTVWECVASSAVTYPARSNRVVYDVASKDEEIVWRGGGYADAQEHRVASGARLTTTPASARQTAGFRVVLVERDW